MRDLEVVRRFLEIQYIDLIVDMLDRIIFDERQEEEQLEVVVEEDEEEEEDIEKEKEEEESDNDFLLDSEEDYEEGDIFFRKYKNRIYFLNNRKGIEQFKGFLEGIVGEKNWRLWIDIDRLVWMNKQEKIDFYVKNV